MYCTYSHTRNQASPHCFRYGIPSPASFVTLTTTIKERKIIALQPRDRNRYRRSPLQLRFNRVPYFVSTPVEVAISLLFFLTSYLSLITARYGYIQITKENPPPPLPPRGSSPSHYKHFYQQLNPHLVCCGVPGGPSNVDVAEGYDEGMV